MNPVTHFDRALKLFTAWCSYCDQEYLTTENPETQAFCWCSRCGRDTLGSGNLSPSSAGDAGRRTLEDK